MSKPRLLTPLSLQFSVRYLLRTGLLARLTEFAQPVVLLAWDDPELIGELEQVGCEVHRLPGSEWGVSYSRVRSYANESFKRRLASPSSAIRERRADLDRELWKRVRRRIRGESIRTALGVPGLERWLTRREEELFWSDTNARRVAEQVRLLKVDAAFSLTPFLFDEEMALRVAKRQGVPILTSILSFDNLTTRSWIPFVADRYLLWNRYNAAELRRGYPEAADSQVELVGSPQFDFYYDPSYVWPEEEWLRELGLESGHRWILLGGGYYTCAPHEPQFLAHLDEAICAGHLPSDVRILFRKHPVDPIDRWNPVLEKARNVVYNEPWAVRSEVRGHTNVRRRDIEQLASTLQHCAVHVNVASTMSIDGAIVDRPQVGPAYDANPGGKYHRSSLECYQQEHFLPLLDSGGIDVATGPERLVEAVRLGLDDPSAKSPERGGLVREACTFHDGRATDRVSAQVAAFVDASVSVAACASAS